MTMESKGVMNQIVITGLFFSI